MAEKRKLLAEMDKCFKKIDEGFEIFDEIMAKMSEANSDNQREKFQDDLKKEIKKLQRLRDQIKGWQNSSDIKDKENLSKFRKKIEERMETFKDIERENKTKPHSKQGLSAEDKLDPKEKEKSDAIDWLNNQIRRIQDEIDRTESKLETINTEASAGGRKRGKKDDAKKNDKEVKYKVEELKKHLERVKFHLLNLEVVMRLITNEKLEIKDVLLKLKEPVEMYIEALDPENELESEDLDPEDIYEELNLNSYIPQLAGFNIGSVDEENKPLSENGGNQQTTPTGSPPPIGSTSREPEQELKQRHQSGTEQVKSILHTPTSITKSVPATPLKLMRRMSVESTSLSSPPPVTPPPPPTIPYNSVAAGIAVKDQVISSQAAVQQPQSTSPPALTTPTATPSSVASSHHNSSSLDEQPGVRQIMRNTERQQSVAANVLPLEPTSPASNGEAGVPAPTPPPAVAPPPGIPLSYNCIAAGTAFSAAPTTHISSIINSLGPVRPAEQLAQHPQLNKSSIAIIPITTTASSVNFAPAANNAAEDLNQNNSNLMRQVLRMGQSAERSTQPQTTTIHPWLGASPLGMVPITGDLELQLNMLTSALPRVPVSMDSEKPRSYLPKMMFQTPPYYPQTPPQNADSLEYYLRLNVESLFFTFYYMEGSRAQLLAAKALKKLSWRFHTKYLMWFQRHEEPKSITDDYEQGTYVYFDFEKWAQRKKEGFTFEYRYLEDKDFD